VISRDADLMDLPKVYNWNEWKMENGLLVPLRR